MKTKRHSDPWVVRHLRNNSTAFAVSLAACATTLFMVHFITEEKTADPRILELLIILFVSVLLYTWGHRVRQQSSTLPVPPPEKLPPPPKEEPPKVETRVTRVVVVSAAPPPPRSIELERARAEYEAMYLDLRGLIWRSDPSHMVFMLDYVIREIQKFDHQGQKVSRMCSELAGDHENHMMDLHALLLTTAKNTHSWS